MINCGKCIVVDIDGTLCAIKGSTEAYADLAPYPEMVERLRELRAQGYYVILQTSRNMRSYAGNIGLINARMLPGLMAWLDTHEVPYDEVHVGKPWAGSDGFYVDDRAVRPAEFLSLTVAEIGELIERDRAPSRLPPVTAGTATDVVITMAGRGQRFRDAGYDIPKFAIEVHGRTLFSWSLLSLSSWLAAGAHVVFVARRTDGVAGFVDHESRGLGVRSHTVVELDATTDGQATTVMAAEAVLRDGGDRPLLVYNIDTHVRPSALHVGQAQGDGWLPCFPGRGSAWSFASAGADGRVREVREKERISDDATVGLYWFGSFGLYRALYDRATREKAGVAAGERYVAPLYNLLVEQGGDVRLSRLPADAVVPLGTPAEVAAFAAGPAPVDAVGTT